MVRVLGLLGVSVCLSLSAACSGDAPPPPKPVPPATPLPTHDPEVDTLDETACKLTVEAGTPVGVFTGDLGDGNELVLHLSRTTMEGSPNTTPDPETAVVGWGSLKVHDLEDLIGIDVDGPLQDPGYVCVSARTAAGAPDPGRIFADDRFDQNLDLTLVGVLPPKTAAEATVKLAADEDAKWIPWPDKPADGKPFVSLRLGAESPHGHPTALEGGDRLRGDVIVALGDGKGQAVYHTAKAR